MKLASGLPTILRSCLLALVFASAANAQAPADPLPSWNDGAAKHAIVDFVQATTTQGSPAFVAPADRIATFDQDGTLWVEHPAYSQLMYILDRVPALVKAKPGLAKAEPFKTVMSGNREAIGKLSLQDLEKLAGYTWSGMSVDEFAAQVKDWLATARDPRWKRPYTDLTYLPMQEVLKYLRSNGYRTYIVTGGGQDFVRQYADAVYGVPVEQVVGTSGAVKYGYDRNGKPFLTKLPRIVLNDNDAGKPEVLVLHDDGKREYAYGPAQGLPASKVGTFTQALYDEAKKDGWVVISMKDDWKRIFSWEQ